MIVRVLLFLLLVSGAPVLAIASGEPQGTLSCGVGFICTIDLPAGAAIVGDPYMYGACRTGSPRTQGCLWQIDWSGKGSNAQTVFLMPNFDSLNSNIVIETSRGAYNVIVKSDTHSGTKTLSFAKLAHSDNGMADSPVAGVPVAGGGASIVPTDALVLRVARAANPDPDWANWFPDYCITSLSKSMPSFKPIFVVNDGARTILAMPYYMHESPSVYGVAPTNERTLFQPAKIGRMWIFDGVPDTIDLIAGDDHLRVRLGRC